MLAVNTDMRAPKDVNAVSVTISTNGAIKHSFIGRVTPQGEVLLPATLAIVEPEDKSAAIRIRVVAFQDRKPRVLRDVRTTIPQGGRTALLRIPLNFVNDGMVVGEPLPPQNVLPDPIPGTGGFTPAGGTGSGAGDGGGAGTGGSPGSAADFDFMGAFQPPCDDIQNQTIIDGECKDSYIDPETLPDLDGAALGDSTDVGSCFDLTRCFAGALGVGDGNGGGDVTPITDAGTGQPSEGGSGSGGGAIDSGAGDGGGKFKDFGVRLSAVTLDRTTCALQLNGANPARLNVALVTPDTGECVRPGECYVPIDRGSGGWKEENGRIQLPSFVCKLLTGKNLRLATSTEVCAAKEEANPICTPKIGDPVPVVPAPDSGPPVGQAVRVVEDDFATASVVFGPFLYFASASRQGRLDLLEKSGAITSISSLAVTGSARLPWRFSSPFAGPLALANGTVEGFVITDGPTSSATKITFPDVTIDVTGYRGFEPLVWAAMGTDGTGSVYSSGLQGSPSKAALPITSVTAILSNGSDNSVVIGGADGTVRTCSLPEQCFPPVTVAGGTRIDGLSPRSDAPGGYVLAANGISQILITSNLVQIAPFIPQADFSGIDEGKLHFARGIANNDKCVFFSSAAGLGYAPASAKGASDIKILAAATAAAPILGVTLGPSPDEAGGHGLSIYYTVFAQKAQGGGVWRVPAPIECAGGSPPVPNPPPGDGGADASGPSCNALTCQLGCCSGTMCVPYGAQNVAMCGNNGAACMPCVGGGAACRTDEVMPMPGTCFFP